MCSCEDAEPCEVWSETIRKARKDHRCKECGVTISRGDHYRFISGIFDGEPFTHKMCAKCVRRTIAFTATEGCHVPIGMLFESIRECGREDPRFWGGFRAKMKLPFTLKVMP